MLIFTGTNSEKPLVRDIVKNISVRGNILNLAGLLNIWELVELLRESFLFISNDTGPVHLAASLGINISVFYGPTSPYRYKPLNENVLIFYKNFECSPCVGIKYVNKNCRNNFRCLDFTPEYVFSKLSERFLE
jgi:ADP-heptose:LPS heptosyltransferase